MSTTRERFVRVLTGQPTDRVPFIKVFGGTNAHLPQWEQECPGLAQTIDEILQFEGEYRGWQIAPVNMGLSRVPPPVVLEENLEQKTVRYGDGTIKILQKDGDFHAQTITWPVTERKDWERIRQEYLQADDPTRFPADWPAVAARFHNREFPLQLTHGGVYGFIRNLLGDVNLAFAFYDNPGLVHDIMDTYTEVALQIWSRMVRDVDFDLIECWEDMASKNGSLISPALFREFMQPNYRRIAEFAKKHGIPVILVDSDGYIEPLTEWMLATGVTAMYPYEVQAGNDVARVLDRCPTVGTIGGLEKNAMALGPAAVKQEMAKARRLIRKGRFIPGPDHFAMCNVSWAQYRYFMESLHEVVMTTTPGQE